MVGLFVVKRRTWNALMPRLLGSELFIRCRFGAFVVVGRSCVVVVVVVELVVVARCCCAVVVC